MWPKAAINFGKFRGFTSFTDPPFLAKRDEFCDGATAMLLFRSIGEFVFKKRPTKFAVVGGEHRRVLLSVHYVRDKYVDKVMYLILVEISIF